MKPSNESRDHSRIHALKEELHKESLEYLKNGIIGRRLVEIIGDGSKGDAVERIITNELT